MNEIKSNTDKIINNNYNQTESAQDANISYNNNTQISENNINKPDNNSIMNNTTGINISESNENNNNMIYNNNYNNNIINDTNMHNLDNQISNDLIDVPEEVEPPPHPFLSFSFKLLFLLNSLAYIQSFCKSYDLKKYTLCLWPIINKNQYYRLITSHFYHLSFFDFLFTMIGFYYATKCIEKEIGSIYTIIIIFHGMISTSILYIIVLWIFKKVLRYSEYNFIYQCGFSSMVFFLFLCYFLLKKNFNRNINISSIDLRGIHSVYFTILMLQLITPSASIVFNTCGASCAFFIFGIVKYFGMPRNYWIIDMEKIFGLNKKNNCHIKYILGYYSLNEKDDIINNVKEFDYFLDNKNRENNNNINNSEINTTQSNGNSNH
jgi:membrane associated rhomboid family serine protease